MQAVTLSGILLISSVAIFVLALFALLRRRMVGAWSFSLLLFAMTIHSTGYAFELTSQTKAEMWGWLQFEYIGIAFFPIIILFFARQYIDEKRIANRWILALVFCLNLISFLLVLTGDRYHLFYQTVELIDSYGLQVLYLPRAFWGNIQHLILIVVLLYAIVGVFRRVRSAQGVYRKRAIFMMLGMLVPLVIYPVFAIGKGPLGIDMMPFTYVLMSVLIGIGLFRFDVLLMTPVTSNMIFRVVDEGLVVVDRNGLLIRFNDAAKLFFPSLMGLKEGSKIVSVKELAGFDFEKERSQMESGERIYNTKRIQTENKRGTIYVFSDVTEAEKNKRELEILATIDPLTGIQNRRVFMEKLKNAPNGTFAILDLDHFKEINDQKGHQEGDRVLKVFAQNLRSFYSYQQVCRYGGEEFAIYFPKTDTETAYQALEKFRLHCIKEQIGVAFSAGISEYDSGQINAKIKKADQKLYEAKANGRNQIQI